MEIKALLQKANDEYQKLIDNVPGFKNSLFPFNQAEDILNSMNQSLYVPFLFIASCETYYSNRPKVFNDIAKKYLDRKTLISYSTLWFELLAENDSNPRKFLPSFIDYKDDLLKEIYINVIKNAPNESNAYIPATRNFLRFNLSLTYIEKFRSLWESLSFERREAIAIGLTEEWPAFSHYQKNTIIILENHPSKLELITGNTNNPAQIHTRKHWIDKKLPLVRSTLWTSFDEACKEFATDTKKLGDERGQVGGLLGYLNNALSRKKSIIETLIKKNGGQADLSIDRYTFSSKEENLWGPDFVMALSFEEKGRIAFQRYVLFQAKLIKDKVVRIPVGQLKNLLRSSWHSSFYIMWEDNLVPRCIPASLIDDYLYTNYALKGKPLAHSPSIKWQELEGITDTLPALLGDRFLSGELGDQLRSDQLSNTSEIAKRVAEIFGKPRFGVFVFKVRVGVQTDIQFRINDEPITLE